MPDTIHSLQLIAVMAAVTMLLRFLPFVIFPQGKTLPGVLLYLGRVLPGAIMAMLVVYCFKNTAVFVPPYALPEAVATAVVAVIYLWRSDVLSAVGIGTVCYMILVQKFFQC